MNTETSPSLCQAWFFAARPKTLAASISPVLLGCALAVHDKVFHVVPAILCFLVAILAQIAANFANDYFDFRNGADRKDRLGPDRAVACGWITPKAMLYGTILTLSLSMLCGLGLIHYGGFKLFFIGLLILLCVLAYTAGPFPLAYNGLGDVCVLIFYGIIPVCLTYYVQSLSLSWIVFFLSCAIGFAATNILVVNNYRDYEQDKESHKKTTIVLFGKKFGEYFYLLNILFSIIFGLSILTLSFYFGIAILIISLFMQLNTWNEMKKFQGKELNKTLAHTSRNVFIYSLLLSLLLFIF